MAGGPCPPLVVGNWTQGCGAGPRSGVRQAALDLVHPLLGRRHVLGTEVVNTTRRLHLRTKDADSRPSRGQLPHPTPTTAHVKESLLIHGLGGAHGGRAWCHSLHLGQVDDTLALRVSTVVVVAQLRGGAGVRAGPSTPHPSGAPSTHLVLRLVQHKPAGLPGLHEGTFLVQGALVGPVSAAGPARPLQGPAPVPSAPLPGPAAKPRRSPPSQPQPGALGPDGLARALPGPQGNNIPRTAGPNNRAGFR